jgi:hypothetical protein
VQHAARLVVIGSILFFAGCGSGKEKSNPRVQQECFHRMMLMSAAGVSYTLENKLPATATLAADALADYLRAGAEGIACPGTQAKYQHFNLAEGPECPEHGKAFQLYSSALADQRHPCRTRALQLLGYPKDPWNDQRSLALIDGLISVVGEEENKAKGNAVATLQRITGQKFGEDAKSWESWWVTNKTTFRFKHRD